MIYLYLVSKFNTWIKHKMNFNSYFINPFYKDSSRHDNSLDACLLCAPSRHVFTTLTISQPRGSAKWETAEISSSKGRGSRQKSSPLPRVTSAGSTALALARENKASMFFFWRRRRRRRKMAKSLFNQVFLETDFVLEQSNKIEKLYIGKLSKSNLKSNRGSKKFELFGWRSFLDS